MGHLRTDSAKLGDFWQSAQIIHFADGALRASEGALTFLTAYEIDTLIESGEFGIGERYFLGKSGNEYYFAWNSSRKNLSNDLKADDAKDGFATLRDIAAKLSDLNVELALHAVALCNWHNSHKHCARCGAPTRNDQGGAVRLCERDQSQHHPRTDSAVIVLVRDSDDRILLGHNPTWPEGRFSCFAGFLEPGETFEHCVSREVFEESGVTVSNIQYLGSQPWPFPASIMISFEALVDDPSLAKPDGEEITEVRWFTREELLSDSRSGKILLPPTISVARKMINRWFESTGKHSQAELTGGERWR